MSLTCKRDLATLSLFVIAITLSPSISTAQFQFPTNSPVDRITGLSQNASFENGLTGWNDPQIPAEIQLRDWQPGLDTASLQERHASLDFSFIRLRGNGVFGQAFALNSKSRRQIFNAFAFKQATNSQSPVGYAAVGVTYYDAAWQELDNIEIPVELRDTNLNRGKGDGMNFYPYGIYAPPGAVNAYIYGYTSTGTDLYLDNLGLFDIVNTKAPGVFPTNLIANPTFSIGYFPGNFTRAAASYGVEFWENSIDWSTGFTGTFGSPNQAEYAYQFPPIVGGRTYALFASVVKYPGIPASCGLDFYDANWRPIGKQFIDLTNANVVDAKAARIETPIGAAHASMVVWGDRLPNAPVDGARIDPQLYELETKTTANTAVIAHSAGLTGSRFTYTGAQITLMYSDRDGIDLTSLDTLDVRFTTKSSTTTYAASKLVVAKVDDTDRLVFVTYGYTGSAFNEIGGITLRANQVKDKKGNFAASKTIRSLLP